MNKNVTLAIIGIAAVLVIALVVTSGNSRGSEESDNVLKIGISGAMTGDNSEYGAHLKYGVHLAVEELKEEAKKEGITIKTVSVDTESKADKSKTQTVKLLKQDKVDVIVGPTSSVEMISAGSDAVQARVPMISPSASNPKATESGKFLFSVAYTDPYQGKIAAQLIADQGKKKVGIIYNNASDYSKGTAKVAEKELKDLGLDVVKETYNTGDTDFNAQLQSLKSKKVDSLFIPDVYGDALKVGTAARPLLGDDVVFYGVDGWGGMVAKTEDNAFEGSYFVNCFAPDADTKEIKSFYKKFKSKHPKIEPTYISANAYDATYIIFDAFKNTKDRTTDELQKELIKTEGDYVGGHVRFTKDRFAEKPAMIIRIEEKNGKLAEVFQEMRKLK